MLSIIVEGQEYTLDDGSFAWYEGEQGWGMLPMHRLSERGPLQDGDTDLGWRGDPRFGKLFFEMSAASRYDLWGMKQSLMTIFRPSRSIILKWNVVHPTAPISHPAYVRQFDCQFASDMDFPVSTRAGFAQKTAVTLKASDPTCYDPSALSLTFQLGGGADSWPVPFAIPFTVGASTIDISQFVYYPGNAISYPHLIRITGPITNPIIYLTQTGVTGSKKLDFTGTTITGGHYYDIDCRYGHKTVTDDVGVNQFSKLTTDSDLSDFYFIPPPAGITIDPVNSLRVTGSSINAATKVDVTYYIRYLGV